VDRSNDARYLILGVPEESILIVPEPKGSNPERLALTRLANDKAVGS
jgi:hypothetical protein